MYLSTSTAEIDFYWPDQFIVTIQVGSLDTDTSSVVTITSTPGITKINTATDTKVVPGVEASYNDPGVTITRSPGVVVISGTYVNIVPVPITYLDNSSELANAIFPNPPAGTYKKIVNTVSPGLSTVECKYIISSEYNSGTTTITTTTSTRLVGTVTTIITTTTTVTNFETIGTSTEFTHIVKYQNYSTVSNMLNLLLIGQPGP
jgi:hypothetical protein